MQQSAHYCVFHDYLVSSSRWISAASTKWEVHQFPTKPALENRHKCNVDPSSNSQSDRAWRPISAVFPTQTKEREFDNFHIWHVASFIKADFNWSLICSLHGVSRGSWWNSCFTFVVRSSRWTTTWYALNHLDPQNQVTYYHFLIDFK